MCFGRVWLQIAKNDGIRALVAAMATHRTNDAVQQYAASALKNLAANNNDNKSLYVGVLIDLKCWVFACFYGCILYASTSSGAPMLL